MGYPDFTEAAEKTVHAVVHIRTSYMQKSNVYDQYYNNNPIYEYFFGQGQDVTKNNLLWHLVPA